MNSELKYVQHPMRSRIKWAVLYAFILIAGVILVWLLSAQVRTRVVPVGKVTLTVPYSRYVVGDNITFDLKNSYNSTIYVVNHCPNEPLAVYRQDNGKWVRIHDQAPLNGCSQEVRQVEVKPGESINGSFKAWPNLFSAPGKYRVVASVEYYNAVLYQDFDVIDKVAPKPAATSPQQSSGTKTPTPTTTTTPTPTSNTRPIEPGDD